MDDCRVFKLAKTIRHRASSFNNNDAAHSKAKIRRLEALGRLVKRSPPVDQAYYFAGGSALRFAEKQEAALKTDSERYQNAHLVESSSFKTYMVAWLLLFIFAIGFETARTAIEAVTAKTAHVASVR